MFDVRLIVQAVLQTYLKRVVSSNGGGWSALLHTGDGAPLGASFGSVKRLTTSGGTVVGPMSADGPRLVLAYYRNQCCYPFVTEAIVAVALLSSGHENAWEEGEEEESLREKVAFLMEILQGQFGKTIKFDKLHVQNVSRRWCSIGEPQSFVLFGLTTYSKAWGHTRSNEQLARRLETGTDLCFQAKVQSDSLREASFSLRLSCPHPPFSQDSSWAHDRKPRAALTVYLLIYSFRAEAVVLAPPEYSAAACNGMVCRIFFCCRRPLSH